MPDLSFVAKKELEKWPIFGAGAKKVNTIFVERNSVRDRSKAMGSLLNAITVEKKAMIVFPSGTTSLDEHHPWKYGAFRLAHQTQVPLQVFRLRYQPLRTVAYIDNDFFPWHLLGVCRPDPIYATVEFADPFLVKNPIEECKRWQAWTREN